VAYNVVFLQQAELDLKELKHYLETNFSPAVWQESYKKIKALVNKLKDFPQMGGIPPELETLHINQYRQVISGANKIIYEMRNQTIYIHLVCDMRRDMKALLTKRLLRII
jgi:plasmid stabilization system protein ParE